MGDNNPPEFSHGTAVASVVAGQPSDHMNAAYGVAWGANVAMFTIPLGSGGGGEQPYNPVTLEELKGQDSIYPQILDTVIGWSSEGRSVDFVNLSFGFGGIIDQYSKEDLSGEDFSGNFGDAIKAMAQACEEGDNNCEEGNKKVLVWAAGNANGERCDPDRFTSNPELCVKTKEKDDDGKDIWRVNAKSVEVLAGLPARIPELRGHVISVVAIQNDEDGSIADFSNRCGIAAEWCLAAPGEQVRVAFFGRDKDTGNGVRRFEDRSGTSFAAPMVTGALAVMQHFYGRDEMSNTALVEKLLHTAEDEGIYANSAVYGHGLLDLEAALSPVGDMSMALGKRVEGPGRAPLNLTRLDLGAAFGDGLSHALAGREVVAFDGMGFPFRYALDGLAPAAGRTSAATRLRTFTASDSRRHGALQPRFARLSGDGGRSRPEFGTFRGPPAGSGHLSFVGSAPAVNRQWAGGLSLSAFSTEGMEGRSPVSGAVAAWRPASGPFGFRVGLAAERKTLLGGRASGAFGQLSGESAHFGLDMGAQAGAWQFDANAEIGTAKAATRDGMLTELSPATTSAFALRAEWQPPSGNGALSLSASQSQRVESGHARLSVPVGRTRDGRVRRETLEAELAPTGRQIDFGAQWRQPLASGEIRLGAVLTRHPGHDARRSPELTALVGWLRAF